MRIAHEQASKLEQDLDPVEDDLDLDEMDPRAVTVGGEPMDSDSEDGDDLAASSRVSGAASTRSPWSPIKSLSRPVLRPVTKADFARAVAKLSASVSERGGCLASWPLPLSPAPPSFVTSLFAH